MRFASARQRQLFEQLNLKQRFTAARRQHEHAIQPSPASQGFRQLCALVWAIADGELDEFLQKVNMADADLRSDDTDDTKPSKVTSL